MIESTLLIDNILGLHARAAAKVVSVASRYSAQISILKDERKVDAKSIMALLMLGAARGTQLKVCVEGEDETQAMAELIDLFERKFDEE
ncbi:MAG: HPr family phosphocarrier protein [Gammaproteobacteria bacterium]|jgi:phosphocarrier protein HPr|nr:HPr family phosphocarrier protein [Gammaproteobacteria bacterium]MBQ0775304.1 HPr family phosphocarrier protein [Gammaproteobacteria bacterium]|tara:strand:+ start:125215 stop:125481 length:267 start_codon:yes stop_codon:yes gene_type:complete